MGFEYGKGRRGIARIARVLLITLALFSTVSIASAQTDDEETAAPDLNLLEPKRSNSKELLDIPSLTLEHLNHAAEIADSGNLPSVGDASEGGDGDEEEHSKEQYDEHGRRVPPDCCSNVDCSAKWSADGGGAIIGGF